jgi:DNA-3-methyladenine glycosylase II
LAEHFESGKLTTKFLSEASVEDISKALIDVRGIGQVRLRCDLNSRAQLGVAVDTHTLDHSQWTVDMFLMFTLRRPDIMPVGDLGVQKGLLKWIVAAYEPFVPPALNASTANPPPDISSVIPIGTEIGDETVPTSNIAFPPSESPMEKKVEQKGLEKALLALQEHRSQEELRELFPLPEGMDLALLKSRLSGKKAK